MKLITIILISCMYAACQPRAYAMEPDKYKHGLVGVFAGSVMGATEGCVLGAVKELYDKVYSRPDVKDFAATCGASVIGNYFAEGESDLYRWNVASIFMDALTTDYAIKNGHEEKGVLLRAIGGSHPSTGSIVLHTGLRLAMLNWSKGWSFGEAYQKVTLATNMSVVYLNYKTAF